MKSLCLSRISKDIKEINKSPLEGIGIISLDNDPKKYIVNLQIMEGIYKGYCIQLLLTFSDDYPLKPPKILIYPGQCLDNTYHHHIFLSDLKDSKGRPFQKFCFDLLENDFLSTSKNEFTGWNPSYTITSLLLQVQIFLSKPDFPTGYVPPENKIKALMKSMDDYENTFLIKNDNNNIVIKHSWKDPYPPMFFKKNDFSENIGGVEKYEELKNDLTCYISRLNYIDDKSILLGYPIKNLEGNNLLPIPELLSYDCFIEETSKNNAYFNNQLGAHNNNDNDNNNNDNNNNNNQFERVFAFLNDRNRNRIHNNLNKFSSFKSANNEFYEDWLPIFINEEHYQKNKTTILNYFSIIKFGNSGDKKFDFHPQYIFEIMPNLLTNMILKMTKGNISSSFIKCFFQYALLYTKLQEKYKNFFYEYQRIYMDKIISNYQKRYTNFDIKKEVLEFLFLFYYSNNNVNTEPKNRIQYILCNILLEGEGNLEHNLFSEILKQQNLFDKIAAIIIFNSYDFLLYGEDNLILFGILAEKVIERMTSKFKLIFNELPSYIKEKIMNILINECFFPVSYFLKKKKRSDIYEHFYFWPYKSKIEIDFSTNYKSILIFEILRKKILSEQFLEKLEKNFGILTDVELLIKQINDDIKNPEIDKIKNFEYYYYIEDFLDKEDHNKYNIEYDPCSLLFYILDISPLKPIEYYDNKFDYLFYKLKKEKEKYPFVKIEEFKKNKYVYISEEINNTILKERKKIFFLKAKFIKKFTKVNNRIHTYKMRKDRINIKKSCSKNINKGYKKYLNKNNNH